jgi:hypothetical protein
MSEDIVNRLLAMSEAMYMDRSQDEVDALLLEAKAEIEGQSDEAARLRRMVERRDEFIIANGLWDSFKEARRGED